MKSKAWLYAMSRSLILAFFTILQFLAVSAATAGEGQKSLSPLWLTHASPRGGRLAAPRPKQSPIQPDSSIQAQIPIMCEDREATAVHLFTPNGASSFYAVRCPDETCWTLAGVQVPCVTSNPLFCKDSEATAIRLYSGNGMTSFYGLHCPNDTCWTLSGIKVACITSPKPGVTSIESGGFHNLVIRLDGSVWSWGSNEHGQLGDGTTTDKPTPVRVAGLSGVTAISAGMFYNLALQGDGTVWGWGENDDGELGDGTTIQRITPVQVMGLTDVVAISAGAHGRRMHSMALKSDGTVWAWGNNAHGALGNGTTVQRLVPVQVVGLNNITAIAAGSDYSLALRQDGTVWAWGDDYNGQLGDGTIHDELLPQQVSGLTDVMAIATGGSTSLALKKDKTVWAWGNNEHGQVGDGHTLDLYYPTEVVGVRGVKAISAGYGTSYVLLEDGTVWAWGLNTSGQLGAGDTTERNAITRVRGLLGIVAISGKGGFGGLALQAVGTTDVSAWGTNSHGQLGDGTSVDKLTPVNVLFP